MNFKNPEILWALLLLIIPVIVHLFQLRKFKKEPFTNVKFLKNVIVQTRKSSKIKKWLILLSRLLALGFLIIAFAQPFTTKRETLTSVPKTFIYLDNSFSMQARGDKGELYKRAVNELIKSMPEKEKFTLFTNNTVYTDITIGNIKNDLLKLEYSSNQLSPDEIFLKTASFSDQYDRSTSNLVIISDFQDKGFGFKMPQDSLIRVYPVMLKPSKMQNISIDSVYISEKDPVNLSMSVVVSSGGVHPELVSISLHDNNELIAKSPVDLKESNSAIAAFTIPSNKKLNGLIKVDDDGLEYDNSLYFNINSPKKVNVLAIGDGDNSFLGRIFSPDEFIFNQAESTALNYSIIPSQQLIILNELKSIPAALTNAIGSFAAKGGNIIIIPPGDADQISYNLLLKEINLPALKTNINSPLKITGIQYDHPVFTGTFESRVYNFSYPGVEQHYLTEGNYATAINYEDGTPFLLNNGNNYMFTAALKKENSNFQNFDLIVPVFYNIAKNSLKLPPLYFTLGIVNTFDVSANLKKDHIITLYGAGSDFIPVQQSRNDRIVVTTDEENPRYAGIYEIRETDSVIDRVSYNYDRSESRLIYQNIDENAVKNMSFSIEDLFYKIKNENYVNELWKWFVIFALVFLTIEMLILKYFK